MINNLSSEISIADNFLEAFIKYGSRADSNGRKPLEHCFSFYIEREEKPSMYDLMNDKRFQDELMDFLASYQGGLIESVLNDSFESVRMNYEGI